jgi:hypothetical protein
LYVIEPCTAPPLTQTALASTPERSALSSLVAALGINVKVSLLKMVRMSPEETLPVTTVLTGTSDTPSAGVVVTAPVGGAAGLIVTENTFVAVPPPVAWTVKLEVPAAVGVPPRTPAADRLRPAGSVPADNDQL